jgi:hypothetical protein
VQPGGHRAEIFHGTGVIGAEPGRARDRLSRADDKHEQRVILPERDDADRQGRFGEPDRDMPVCGKDLECFMNMGAVPAVPR